MELFALKFFKGIAINFEFRLKPISKHKSSSTVEKKITQLKRWFSENIVFTR